MGSGASTAGGSEGKNRLIVEVNNHSLTYRGTAQSAEDAEEILVILDPRKSYQNFKEDLKLQENWETFGKKKFSDENGNYHFLRITQDRIMFSCHVHSFFNDDRGWQNNVLLSYAFVLQ